MPERLFKMLKPLDIAPAADGDAVGDATLAGAAAAEAAGAAEPPTLGANGPVGLAW